MSTRANVIIRKGDRHLIFYRHCDGYPKGLGVDLECCINPYNPLETLFNILEDCNLEITDSIHGDIEYLYTITLNEDFVTMSFVKV